MAEMFKAEVGGGGIQKNDLETAAPCRWSGTAHAFAAVMCVCVGGWVGGWVCKGSNFILWSNSYTPHVQLLPVWSE